MEGNGLGLHLTLLNVDLVTSEDNRDTLADTDEITWNMSGVKSSKEGEEGGPNARRKPYGASWGRSCR